MSTFTQRSFAAGELTEALRARVDTVKYATGASAVRNNIVMRHGGTQNRAGTQYVSEVKDSTSTVRLFPFEFNAEQTYILQFGHQYMRVIRNGVQLSDLTLTITGITNANPAVVSYSGTDPANGNEVFLAGIAGALGTKLNGRNFKIANLNTATNTFDLKYLDGTNVNSTAFGAYTSGGTADRIYELTTPYAAADLPQVKFTQSADVMTLTHPSYPVQELTRFGHTSWAINDITLSPDSLAPDALTVTAESPNPSYLNAYALTAVSFSGEESVLSNALISDQNASSGTPTTVTWADMNAAGVTYQFNLYKKKNATAPWGLLAIINSDSNSYIDDGAIDPDFEAAPPITQQFFNATGKYPSTVGYLQQRLSFGNTNNAPETVYMSRTGRYHNFTTNQPAQDDQAIEFSLAGRKVNEIKHLLDLGRMVILTSGGEWVAGSEGPITPTSIGLKQQSYNGASDLQPLIIGETALYVQARGNIVRELGFDYQVDGYRGGDITIMSAHLLRNHTIVDWTFQQIPDSIAWIVREDGILLGVTYVRDQQIIGWHRHDFDGGTVENVCSVAEGDEDALYLVIKRTVSGQTKRYIERMNTRNFEDIEDARFVDCGLTYDGRNTNGSHTMTISGGTSWNQNETLTITSSASYFSAAEIGNEIHLPLADGTSLRFSLVGYTNATTMTGIVNKTVPVAMRNTATSDWSRAVDELGGLWHIEGKQVSIFADGFVVASPNNPAYAAKSVSNGGLSLEDCYSVIHVGLPITADLETLNIDTPNGETLSDKKMNISKVSVHLDRSRGIWAGGAEPVSSALDGLTELKIRNSEGYDDPVALASGVQDIVIQSTWNSNGRVFIRQVDPVPLSILAVSPAGMIPIRG